MSVGNRAIDLYVQEILQHLSPVQAREYFYRPALKVLGKSPENIGAFNDPKRSEAGNLDFIFLSSHSLAIGHSWEGAKHA